MVDEEDVVQNAFENFFRQVQEDRFPKLDDRNDLWQILCMLVDRRAKDQIAKLNTMKGGGKLVHGDSINIDPSRGPVIENVAIQPTDKQGAEFMDSFEHRLKQLDTDAHRKVALAKLELKTNQEIADELEMSLRSVERRLADIRKAWKAEED